MQRTTLDVPDDLARRFDELARHSGQSREAVMLEVLEAYLEQIAEADRGEVVDAEVVHADAEALIAQLGVSPEERAKIRAEVRAEMERAYGVSLCE